MSLHIVTFPFGIVDILGLKKKIGFAVLLDGDGVHVGRIWPWTYSTEGLAHMRNSR